MAILVTGGHWTEFEPRQGLSDKASNVKWCPDGAAGLFIKIKDVPTNSASHAEIATFLNIHKCPNDKCKDKVTRFWVNEDHPTRATVQGSVFLSKRMLNRHIKYVLLYFCVPVREKQKTSSGSSM